MIVDNISGGYSGGFFLENISFNISPGKMYALLGLNGSGKTTIIKMITGLLKAKSGSILVGNKDILTLNERERAKIISYVPQYTHIVYDISVIDVVLMGITPYLKIFETPNKYHREQAYKILDNLGIGNVAHKNFQTLSGGLKQMVIIARAMLQNGKYLILDEPDSSLDLSNKKSLMEKLRHITDKYQKGSLLSMHNPEYALNYCDNIILIKDGKLTEINLEKEEISSIEKKLSDIYGALNIIEYKNKFIIYYE